MPDVLARRPAAAGDPRSLPDLPLAEAGGVVAEGREQRDGLGLDQFGDEGGHVEIVTAAVEGGDPEELGVAAAMSASRAVDRQGGSVRPGVGPVARAIRGGRAASPQGPLMPVVPGLVGSSGACIRAARSGRCSFVSIISMRRSTEVAVVVGPVAGELGDRGRAVPLEPGGLSSPCRHLPGHDDLEGPLAQVELGGIVGRGCPGRLPAGRKAGSNASRVPLAARSSDPGG